MNEEVEISKYIGFEFVKDFDENLFKKLPERNTRFSAGYDFYNPERVVIPAHSLKLIKTGIKSSFPSNIVLKLYNRSSNPKKKGVFLANGVGIVDADYYGNPDNDGNIGFMFYNYTDQETIFEAGDKLGQGIFEKYYIISNEQEITSDRTGGFGSTGR